VHPDGSGLRRLTGCPPLPGTTTGGCPVDTDPTWSPDGSLIAFTRFPATGSGGSGVFTIVPGGVGAPPGVDVP
jgi:Tol biopolymer transport system component